MRIFRRVSVCAGRRWAVAAGLVVVLTSFVSASAQPSVGAPFPAIAARDLSGESHRSVLTTGQPNLVVVMTHRDGADAVRAWFRAADGQLPATVFRVSVVSLRLPFFVSDDLVRGRARSETPRPAWRHTFIDRDGGMAGALELPETAEPFVYAIAADGRVLASARGLPTGGDAQAIWRALTATSN